MNELPAGILILIIILSVLLFAVVLFSIWAFTEPFLFRLTERKLRKAGKGTNFKKQDPVSPAASAVPDLRLFFFCDLHAELCRVKPARLIAAIREAHSSAPLDAVIFGGDICNKSNAGTKGLVYLKEISDTCSDLGIPFYGVTGNHDLKFDPGDLASLFTSIGSEKVQMTSHATGKPVYLCGVNDSGKYERVWYKVPSVPSDCVSVLVCHNPDAILYLESDDHVDFMLSGHFHAGQLRLPFHLEFATLRTGILPHKGVIDGVFEHKGTTLFISRGLGCNVLPIRFRAIPEASVVEIYS